MNVKFRYIYEDVDRHGNVRIYFWRGKGHRKCACERRLDRLSSTASIKL